MITLRKITASDASLLIRWRNADVRFFGDQTLLTPERHDRWYYGTYLNDPRDHMYLVLHDDIPVGTIGVKLGDISAEIVRVLLGEKSFACAGVMSTALELITNAYRGPYWLSVKRDNIPAIRLYRKNGFVTYHEDEELFYMRRS